MDKEIQYMPVGRVRRRRRTWAPDHERSGPDADGRRRADRHRVLAGAGFGVGLAAVTVFF